MPYYTMPMISHDAGGGGGGSDRALRAGGNGDATTIDYIDIATTGNATDFGDLVYSRWFMCGLGSATRMVFSGGWNGSSILIANDYVTLATTGNGSDFGDSTANLGSSRGALSNSTRGIFGGGRTTSFSDLNVIDYITIATTGNCTDFGDVSTPDVIGMAGTASTTRGLINGGSEAGTGSSHNVIGYVTIASTGNATDFGDLTTARIYLGGASSSTRSVCAGGDNSTSNVIDYTTIASTGNATDFGDLQTSKAGMGGTSNSTRAVFCGGNLNVIGYVTIASTGNATDFGDLTGTQQYGAMASGSHGGI